MKPDRSCQFPGCGLVRSAGVHAGAGLDKHEYVPPRKEGGFGSQRQPLSPRSESPKRVERRQEGVDEAVEHHLRVNRCEARDYGVLTPCGTGADGILEHSHSIGKGMGGGQDYAVTDGACAILCRLHHRAVDTDRAAMREAGLSQRAPRPAKVVPRQVEQKPPIRRRWEDD